MQHLNGLLRHLKPRHDDVFVDRFNYIYTPMMFFAFASLMAAKQYVGQPIQCWAPAEFRGPWEKYIENLCFVENTYYVNVNENLPKNPMDRESRKILYYQWVPFFLSMQMILFMLPKCLWNTLNWKSGISISSLVNQAMMTKTDKINALKETEEMQTSSQLVASRLEVVHRSAAFKSDLKPNKQGNGNEAAGEIEFIDYRILKPRQNFVTFLYIAFKILNLLNSVIQLYFLNVFLGPEYQFWGVGIITDLLRGRKWHESGHFPRVTFCDTEIRQPGNVPPLKFTVQCVLMNNMFNEKIYIFVWFWLLTLSIFNFLDCINWIWISSFWTNQIRFARSRMNNMKIGMEESELKLFVKHCLCRDGCTTLRLIDHNCCEITCAEIMKYLWIDFRKNLTLAGA